MSDDNKIANQNTKPVSKDDQVQPVAPAGSTNKEMGPVSSSVSDYATEIEPQIDRDLKELGIEAKKENLNLTEEHKQAGIGYAKESSPVSSSPTGRITVPMSEKEVADELRSGRDEDSRKSLAKLIGKVIKAMLSKI